MIDVTNNDLNTIIDIDLEIGTVVEPEDYPIYEGSYVVTPRITEQVLDTKNKSLLDDITIFQIPYASVSNPSGGSTVTIGLE